MRLVPLRPTHIQGPGYRGKPREDHILWWCVSPTVCQRGTRYLAPPPTCGLCEDKCVSRQEVSADDAVLQNERAGGVGGTSEMCNEITAAIIKATGSHPSLTDTKRKNAALHNYVPPALAWLQSQDIFPHSLFPCVSLYLCLAISLPISLFLSRSLAFPLSPSLSVCVCLSLSFLLSLFPLSAAPIKGFPLSAESMWVLPLFV